MATRIGHRGSMGNAPENTLVSFRTAVAAGVDGVEFDVHRTRDGHLVVCHDPYLDRTTTGSGLIRDLTLAEVRAVDAGVRFHPRFVGERVPTLAEAVAAVPPPLGIYVELKAGSLQYPGIEVQLLAELRGMGVLARVQVSSFDHHALRRLKALHPALPTGALYMGYPGDPVGMGRWAEADYLHPNIFYATPELVQAAAAAGLQVIVWSVNDPWLIAAARQWGVSGIISDFPERL